MTQYYFYAIACADANDYIEDEVLIEFDLKDDEIVYYRVSNESTGEQIRGDIEFCINPEEMMEPYRNYTKDIESFILANKKDWRE